MIRQLVFFLLLSTIFISAQEISGSNSCSVDTDCRRGTCVGGICKRRRGVSRLSKRRRTNKGCGKGKMATRRPRVDIS